MNPQFLDFQWIIEKYRSQGFNITIFPCNQFLLQEPEGNAQVLDMMKYIRPGNGFVPNVGMDVYGILNVNGAERDPLYGWLTHSCGPPQNNWYNRQWYMYNTQDIRDISWNFEKFLIDKTGMPRWRFAPSNWYNGTAVIPYIEKLLAE